MSERWAVDLHRTYVQGGRTYAYVFNLGELVPIAAVVIGVEGMPQDEGRARAHLIGAAPEMLAALVTSKQRIEQLAAMLNAVRPDKVRASDFTDVADTAIAKAKGGTADVE